MAILNKIIKLTQEQYDTLASGGTVGEYTGIDANYLYLVQSEESTNDNYVDLTSDQNIQGVKTFRDGIKFDLAPNVIIGGDQVANELIYAPDTSTILAERGNDLTLITVEDSDLGLHNLIEPTEDTDAATKKYVDLVNLENQTKVKRFI